MIKIGTFDLDLVDIPTQKLEEILMTYNRQQLIALICRICDNITQMNDLSYDSIHNIPE